jgi:asparagine synthase (glutamine-hydrolysing)
MCRILVLFDDIESGIKKLERMKHGGHTFKHLVMDNIFFGHIRLAIQGLDKKYDCPYETKNEIILYNGEIFNFKELMPEAKCDIQLLPGNNHDVDSFDGDFAVVKYNKENKYLEIYTDRFGKRQLYYKIRNNKIVGIASEIKALVDTDDEIDINYISTCARFGYNFGNDNTIVKSIKRFYPDTRYIISENGKILNVKKINHNKTLFKEDFKVLLEKSIKRRLVSDIPIAFLYSGGLDSSIVLYHLHKLGQKLEIFTIENGQDQVYAKKYAESLGYKINTLELGYYNYEAVHLHNESGCDLGSVIPNWLLFEAIKNKGYNVVITADGADEGFGGYSRMKHFDFQYNDIYNELIYYHLPRLDKEAMAHTIEYRSPFTADYILDFALNLPYIRRIDKEFLKTEYSRILPDYIINRNKEPLKIDYIREDKEIERINLAKVWRYVLFDKLKGGNKI